MAELSQKGRRMPHSMILKIATGVITALLIAAILAAASWPGQALRQEIGGVNADVETLRGELGTVRSEVKSLDREQSELKSDLRVMKNDIGYIREGITELKAR